MNNSDIKDIIVKTKDNRLLLTLNRTLYEKEAIFSAAYKFTDKFTILIEPIDPSSVGVYFKSQQGGDENELMMVAEAFCNEVLDQQIRLDIERKYGNIRDLIVAQAFSPISKLKDKIKLA